MTQKNIDQLLFTRDKYYKFLERAKDLALSAIKLENLVKKLAAEGKPTEKAEQKVQSLKNSALGNLQQHESLTRKINRVSNHLYQENWAPYSSDFLEKVAARRILETKNEERRKAKAARKSGWASGNNI